MYKLVFCINNKYKTGHRLNNEALKDIAESLNHSIDHLNLEVSEIIKSSAESVQYGAQKK